jgi:hypothetical protein
MRVRWERDRNGLMRCRIGGCESLVERVVNAWALSLTDSASLKCCEA